MLFLAIFQVSKLERTVCYVEDDPDLRADIVELLELQELIVSSYESAEDCLADMVADESHSLYIFDLTLPGRSGAELAQEVRALGLRAPILILSGEADLECVEELTGQCDAVFMAKPFKFEDLIRRVTALTATSR